MAKYCELPEEEPFSWVWTAGREVQGECRTEAGYVGRELLQGSTEQGPGPGITVMGELPGCGEGTR